MCNLIVVCVWTSLYFIGMRKPFRGSYNFLSQTDIIFSPFSCSFVYKRPTLPSLVETDTIHCQIAICLRSTLFGCSGKQRPTRSTAEKRRSQKAGRTLGRPTLSAQRPNIHEVTSIHCHRDDENEEDTSLAENDMEQPGERN